MPYAFTWPPCCEVGSALACLPLTSTPAPAPTRRLQNTTAPPVIPVCAASRTSSRAGQATPPPSSRSCLMLWRSRQTAGTGSGCSAGCSGRCSWSSSRPGPGVHSPGCAKAAFQPIRTDMANRSRTCPLLKLLQAGVCCLFGLPSSCAQASMHTVRWSSRHIWLAQTQALPILIRKSTMRAVSQFALCTRHGWQGPIWIWRQSCRALSCSPSLLRK